MFSRFLKLSKSRINKIVPFKRAKDKELADKLQKTNHLVLSKSTPTFKALTIQKSDYKNLYKGKSTDAEKKIDKYLDREFDLIVLFSTDTNPDYDFKKENFLATVSTRETLAHPETLDEWKRSDDGSVYTTGSDNTQLRYNDANIDNTNHTNVNNLSNRSRQSSEEEKREIGDDAASVGSSPADTIAPLVDLYKYQERQSNLKRKTGANHLRSIRTLKQKELKRLANRDNVIIDAMPNEIDGHTINKQNLKQTFKRVRKILTTSVAKQPLESVAKQPLEI